MKAYKTLDEEFKGEELDMITHDLAKTADIIDAWLEGEAVDPDLLKYMAMALSSLSEKFPQEV